jgi:hypothetical protein
MIPSGLWQSAFLFRRKITKTWAKEAGEHSHKAEKRADLPDTGKHAARLCLMVLVAAL